MKPKCWNCDGTKVCSYCNGKGETLCSCEECSHEHAAKCGNCVGGKCSQCKDE